MKRQKISKENSSFCFSFLSITKHDLSYTMIISCARPSAYVRSPIHAYIYNNVYTEKHHSEIFISVKSTLKSQLFCEKIWWNGK